MMRYLLFLGLLFVYSHLQAQDTLSYDQIREAYYRSYQYEKVQDYENAIRALLPVYEAYPRGYTVNLRLGWLYYLSGHYANALEHYSKAVQMAPAAVEARLGYMLPLLAQGRYPEAEQVAYQILSTDYYNYYGNLRLTYTLRMQQKWELAEAVARKMLTLYPTDVSFLVELGLIRAGVGASEEARAIFRDVLILDPENETARSYLQR